jgi:hypothetical protein
MLSTDVVCDRMSEVGVVGLAFQDQNCCHLHSTRVHTLQYLQCSINYFFYVHFIYVDRLSSLTVVCFFWLLTVVSCVSFRRWLLTVGFDCRSLLLVFSCFWFLGYRLWIRQCRLSLNFCFRCPALDYELLASMYNLLQNLLKKSFRQVA